MLTKYFFIELFYYKELFNHLAYGLSYVPYHMWRCIASNVTIWILRKIFDLMHCINSVTPISIRQIDCVIDNEKMVQLMKISIYLVIVSVRAVTAGQTTTIQLNEWKQTPRSNLPSLENQIQSLLIGYYQENGITVHSVGLPRISFSFQKSGVDTLTYDTWSVIKIDGVDYLFFISINEIFPSRFFIGEVEQYPCVQSFRPIICSCQDDASNDCSSDKC